MEKRTLIARVPHVTKPKPAVLLVEADAALRRLIALGLQKRGIEVNAVRSLADLPSVMRRPQLLLLDIDSGKDGVWSSLASAQSDAYLSGLPIVVLGWEDEIDIPLQQTGSLPVAYLHKPFDARTLLATIEDMLAAEPYLIRAQSPDMLPTTRSAHSTSSIWPLLTALGLLLACIGLMGPFALTVCGLLVVLASLLWWTLGTEPEQPSLWPEPSTRNRFA